MSLAPKSLLPLDGVQVLDLSRILAGPMCAMALGDLGATVIKVEHPQRGDDTRDWGAKVGARNTAYFNSANRNKTSITVDLQTADGQRIVRDLAARSDVVVQNFKYGGLEKLGLGYEDLRKINPRLVYCSIAGYGSDGPEAARPGYDLVVQGEAGLMAMNGEEGSGPLKFGVAVVDMFTGMYAAQAVLAALLQRERTDCGRLVELALFDCGMMITSYYGMEALLSQQDPPKFGNEHPSIVPYGVFEAADGPLVITVGNNQQFQRFCSVLDRADLAQDQRFSTNTSRSANRTELMEIVRVELARRTRRELLEQLASSGIPCGEVLGLLEALHSPRAKAAGLVTTMPHAEVRSLPVLSPPYRFDGARLPVRSAPPMLGQGTDDVLNRVLGISQEDITKLRAQGIV